MTDSIRGCCCRWCEVFTGRGRFENPLRRAEWRRYLWVSSGGRQPRQPQSADHLCRHSLL